MGNGMDINDFYAAAERYGASKYVHNYLKTYNNIFKETRAELKKVLEIGLQAPHQQGSSIRMWEDYFPNADIFGIDINPERSTLSSNRTKVEIIDSSKENAGEDFKSRNGGNFDLIIDDGSHWYEDQINTFRNFWPLVKNGGYYVVEDLVSGDGPHRYYAIQAFKELIDGLNFIRPNFSTGHWYLREAQPINENTYIDSVASVLFIQNAIFIHKGDTWNDNPWLDQLQTAPRIPIEQTPARNASSLGEKLHKALRIVLDRQRRFLVPRQFTRAPGFLDRFARRIR